VHFGPFDCHPDLVYANEAATPSADVVVSEIVFCKWTNRADVGGI